MGVFSNYVKQTLASSNSLLSTLVIVNVVIFIALRVIALVAWLFNYDVMPLLDIVAVSSSWRQELLSPWTILTYMFVHYDLWHILFNMLWLWWMGQIFLEYFYPKHLVALYLYGGMAGALLYLVAYAVFPAFAFSHAILIGASASVMAIVVAVAMRSPNYPIRLMFLGEVPLKWIAIITIAISLLSINSSNAGGNIAHIGGALTGMVFALAYKKGIDITRPLNSIIDWIVNTFKRIQSPKFNDSHSKKRRYTYASSTTMSNATSQDEDELNQILDKIKRSGYSALSEEEKKRLFMVSKRVKR